MTYTIVLNPDARCRSCIRFRRFEREFEEWASPVTEDTPDEIMDYIEAKCGKCAEGAWVERHGTEFRTFIATNDAA